MHSLKRRVITLTSLVLLSTSMVTNAETSQESIHSNENQLQQNAEMIHNKKIEKQQIASELENVQKALKTIEVEIIENTKAVNAIQQKIDETTQLIENKKEEIVILQDKVHTRKGVMEERLVSLQHNNKVNLIVSILVNADSLTDLFERVTAVSTILGADKDLLEQQKNDLAKIEEEKRAIDQQEKLLEEQYTDLAKNQADLENSLLKRQQDLAAVQAQYDAVSKEIDLAEKEKEYIQDQLNQAQNKLKQESQNVVSAIHTANERKTQPVRESSNVKQEMYVTATAYSHEGSKTGKTYMGHDIKKNPNMKIIAVDPSIIPLGSKVWVEGYGEAIAGDIGSAIKGHKIDVLMPSSYQAVQWGRKVVKISILN